MSLVSPQTELPRGLSGASDTWDDGPAGVIISGEFFAEPASGTVFNDSRTEAAAAVEACSVTLVRAVAQAEALSSSAEAGSSTVIETTTAAPGLNDLTTWSPVDVTATGIASPYPATVRIQISAGAGSSSHYLTPPAASNYRGSFLVELVGNRSVAFGWLTLEQVAIVLLQNGTLAVLNAPAVPGRSISGSATPLGGGWYRVDFATVDNSTLPTSPRMQMAALTGATTYDLLTPLDYSYVDVADVRIASSEGVKATNVQNRSLLISRSSSEAGSAADSHDSTVIAGGTTFNVQGEGLDGTSYTNLVGYAQTAMSTATTTTPYPNSFAITEVVGFGTHSVSASASLIGGVRGDFSFVYKLPTNRMLNVTVGAVTCNMVSPPSSWSFSGLDNGSPIQHTVDNLGSGYYRLTVWNVRNGSNTLMVAGKDTYGDSFYDGDASKAFIIADLRLFATGRAADASTRGLLITVPGQRVSAGAEDLAQYSLYGATRNSLAGQPYPNAFRLTASSGTTHNVYHATSGTGVTVKLKFKPGVNTLTISGGFYALLNPYVVFLPGGGVTTFGTVSGYSNDDLGGGWRQASVTIPSMSSVVIHMARAAGTLSFSADSSTLDLADLVIYAAEGAVAAESPVPSLSYLIEATNYLSLGEDYNDLSLLTYNYATVTVQEYGRIVFAESSNAADPFPLLFNDAVLALAADATLYFEVFIPAGRWLEVTVAYGVSYRYIEIDSDGTVLWNSSGITVTTGVVGGGFISVEIVRTTSPTLVTFLQFSAATHSTPPDPLKVWEIRALSGLVVEQGALATQDGDHIPGDTEINESQTDAAASAHTDTAQLEAVAAYLASLSATDAPTGTAQLNAARTEPATAAEAQAGTLQTYTSYTALLVAGWGATTALVTTASDTAAAPASHAQQATQSTNAADTAVAVASHTDAASGVMPSTDTAAGSAGDVSSAAAQLTSARTEPGTAVWSASTAVTATASAAESGGAAHTQETTQATTATDTAASTATVIETATQVMPASETAAGAAGDAAAAGALVVADRTEPAAAADATTGIGVLSATYGAALVADSAQTVLQIALASYTAAGSAQTAQTAAAQLLADALANTSAGWQATGTAAMPCEGTAPASAQTLCAYEVGAFDVSCEAAGAAGEVASALYGAVCEAYASAEAADQPSGTALFSAALSALLSAEALQAAGVAVLVAVDSAGSAAAAASVEAAASAAQDEPADGQEEGQVTTVAAAAEFAEGTAAGVPTATAVFLCDDAAAADGSEQQDASQLTLNEAEGVAAGAATDVATSNVEVQTVFVAAGAAADIVEVAAAVAASETAAAAAGHESLCSTVWGVAVISPAAAEATAAAVHGGDSVADAPASAGDAATSQTIAGAAQEEAADGQDAPQGSVAAPAYALEAGTASETALGGLVLAAVITAPGAASDAAVADKAILAEATALGAAMAASGVFITAAAGAVASAYAVDFANGFAVFVAVEDAATTAQDAPAAAHTTYASAYEAAAAAVEALAAVYAPSGTLPQYTQVVESLARTLVAAGDSRTYVFLSGAPRTLSVDRPATTMVVAPSAAEGVVLAAARTPVIVK